MSSKTEKEKQKQLQEKCQTILSQLLRDEDNKYCVDCDAKGPRWASWNLGIFLCIRCAGIHRNLGVHISKVKSVNLDAWTPEQVACLQQMGNSRARAVYEANLPDNFRRPQTDSSLEAFIRGKYEQKKYIAKEWVPPPMPKPPIEFDEEKKKTKEKKAGKASGLEVPLPGGGSSVSQKTTSTSFSGTSSMVTSSKKTEPKEKVSGSGAVDLLGLNEPTSTVASEIPGTPTDDPFGRFLSAESSGMADLSGGSHSSSDGSKIPNGQSALEIEGLGSQFAVDDLQKKQQPLSKESILSLYGQGPPVPQQPPVIGMPGALFPGQPPALYGCPNIPIMGGMPTVPIMGGHMVSGMAISNIPPTVPQANLTGTNPFFSSGSCGSVGGWFSATNPGPQPANFNQVQQQMASLNLGAPTFGNVLPQVPTVGWTAQQPGQTLSTNLWQ